MIIVIGGYYFGIIFGGKAGQAGWAKILAQDAPILIENGSIFDRSGPIYQIPVGGGHIVCSQHSNIATQQHSTLLCSRHSTPLVGPQHSPLFATQHSSDGTTALCLCATAHCSDATVALSSDRNNKLLWWGHNTFVCW